MPDRLVDAAALVALVGAVFVALWVVGVVVRGERLAVFGFIALVTSVAGAIAAGAQLELW